MKKTRAIILLLLGGSAVLFGEVSFSDLQLSQENRLLFQAAADGPGHADFRTLFLADLVSGARTQLSFYPEALHFLPRTGGLQIQNRFGLFRSAGETGEMVPVKGFPSFLEGLGVRNGKMTPVLTSPDGRYILHLEAASPAYGDLLLFDTTSGRSVTVARGVELSLGGPGASWSPDSLFFIYARDRKLHYFSMEQYREGRLLAENFREIGDGGMKSVRWGTGGELFYISGTLVYRIGQSELFTRTLYRDLIRIGQPAGKIPFEFDPNFDFFRVSPDGGKILLCVGGRNIFIYALRRDDYRGGGESLSLPYLYLPRNTRVAEVLWSRGGVVTLLTWSPGSGSQKTEVFRLDLAAGASAFTKTDDAGIRGIILSPDETRALLIKETELEIRGYSAWTSERTLEVQEPVGAVWAGNSGILAGDSRLVRSIAVETGEARFICFSQPDRFGFREGAAQITARGITRGYDPATGRWSEPEAFTPAPATTVSSRFRVFLEPLPSGPLRNTVMVRGAVDPGTYALFTHAGQEYEPVPDKAEPVDFDNFAHGSRIHGRDTALVFDAIDSVEGLETILSTLAEYGIRATFFINGEFIRRNPEAVREIADSGHEVGSLFFAHFNMTDPRFGITKDFIRQGLARNEDDYFAVTGKELSLLWHAPYYFTGSDIIRAGRELNYRYVGRDVDSLDWVVKQDAHGKNRLHFPAAALVERALEKIRPGSISSMRVGRQDDSRTDSRRDDYLFHKLDLLLNGLLARGYRILTVSGLMDKAK